MDEDIEWYYGISVNRQFSINIGDNVVWGFSHECGVSARVGEVITIDKEEGTITVEDNETGEIDYTSPESVFKVVE